MAPEARNPGVGAGCLLHWQPHVSHCLPIGPSLLCREKATTRLLGDSGPHTVVFTVVLNLNQLPTLQDGEILDFQLGVHFPMAGWCCPFPVAHHSLDLSDLPGPQHLNLSLPTWGDCGYWLHSRRWDSLTGSDSESPGRRPHQPLRGLSFVSHEGTASLQGSLHGPLPLAEPAA